MEAKENNSQNFLFQLYLMQPCYSDVVNPYHIYKAFLGVTHYPRLQRNMRSKSLNVLPLLILVQILTSLLTQEALLARLFVSSILSSPNGGCPVPVKQPGSQFCQNASCQNALHEPSAGHWPTWQSCCLAWPASSL